MRIPKPERLALLTPEQRALFDKWQDEQQRSEDLAKKALIALANGDRRTYQTCLTEMESILPSQCEHGEDIFGECSACSEIEHLVFPELFDANGNLMEEEADAEIQKIINQSLN